MPSHCLSRFALLEILTLCVAGTQYVAILAPWSDHGEALEPNQSAAAAR